MRRSEAVPLFGLVLAGGASTRMHKDKALMEYRGKPQIARAFELLEAVCEQTFVSVRADQVQDGVRQGLPQIVDRREGIGPIAGIHGAQAEWPEKAWLVLACDLPFVDDATLEHLLAHRDASKLVTAYLSSHDGLPEPLCAVYEPRSRAAIESYIDGGGRCPRKFLIGAGADVCLLTPPDPRALDNINTPAEYDLAIESLQRK